MKDGFVRMMLQQKAPTKNCSLKWMLNLKMGGVMAQWMLPARYLILWNALGLKGRAASNTGPLLPLYGTAGHISDALNLSIPNRIWFVGVCT